MNTLNNEDIIRRFLDLHPETPFDMTEYAIPLLTIRHLAGAIAAAEREACAKLLDQMAEKDKLSNYYKVAALAIRARGQHD